MKIVDGLNYREWQQRNTEAFSKLERSQQQEARSEGYRNVGWDNVQKSWGLLSGFFTEVRKNSSQEVSIFDHKLNKGDLLGAINHSILEAEQAQAEATEALERLEKNYENVKQTADEALSKYQLL